MAHQAFIEDYLHIKSGLNSGTSRSRVAIQTQKSLVTLLLNHIAQTDKALGTFLKAQA